MQFEAGVAKEDMTAFIPGIGMMGYAQAHNTVKSVATPLLARALFLRDGIKTNFILVHLEQCFVTIAIKEEVLSLLDHLHPAWNITDENLMITAQHTHSAPGGYSHYPLYNFMVPNFQLKVFNTVVTSAIKAIEKAYRDISPVTLEIGETIIPVEKEIAFNRSMSAFLNNPDVDKMKPEETHLAIDRKMQGLLIKKVDGKTKAFINWFGVHATSISSHNQSIHHDNKGVAAQLYEKSHPWTTAFFLQSSAGDVSPNYIWDKSLGRMRGKYKDQYQNAEFNGELQFREAEKIQASQEITGKISFHHLWVDMAKNIATPAHGAAFFRGTLEGPGVSEPLYALLKKISQKVRKTHLEKNSELHRAFYEAQHPKDVILDHRTGSFLGIPLKVWKKLPPLPEPSVEALRKAAKKNSIDTLPWVPPIIPLQLIRIGELVIAAVPGEITTVAGRRLSKQILKDLSQAGVTEVIISSYANAYMGYITTPEEYDLQSYEAGHTVYGRRTFNGIEQGFKNLAADMLSGSKSVSEVRPFHFPADELARRTI